MTRFGLLIDMDKCNGCYGCVMACRDEFCGNDHPPYSAAQPYSGHFWMRIIERERGSYPKVKMSYIKVPCMHCDDAPCVSQHPGKVYSRPDGVVIIDPVKAEGSKEILDSCPYSAIYWNEEKSLPQKCTLCAHLLDQGWTEPRCVEMCPTKALLFGDLDDPESEVSVRLRREPGDVLHPEYGLKEKVRYLHMPKRFIAGSLIFGDTDRCASNVAVSLHGGGEEKKTVTNGFGDFEFEGLEKNLEYTIAVEHPGYLHKEIEVTTKIDEYVGDIVLAKAER
jgi:Fe-S-cluster-containing dehydrogenase component